MIYLKILQIVFFLFIILLFVSRFILPYLYPGVYEKKWFSLFKPNMGDKNSEKSSADILSNAETLEAEAGQAKKRASKVAAEEIKNAEDKIRKAKTVKRKTKK